MTFNTKSRKLYKSHKLRKSRRQQYKKGGNTDRLTKSYKSPKTHDPILVNINTTTQNLIECTKLNSSDIRTNFLLQFHKPNKRLDRSIIAKPCISVGNSGTFNKTCISEFNPQKCNEKNVKVLIRESKKPIPEPNIPASEIAAEIDTLKQSINNILFMSDNNIGPKIYDIQYTQSSTIIYVMESFQMDLKTFIDDMKLQYPFQSITNPTDQHFINIVNTLRKQTIYILKTMAKNDFLCLDIKPENAVVNVKNTDDITLRFIDVDDDYCGVSNNTIHPIKYILSTRKDKLDLAYKFMLVLFANHLSYYDFNYLAPIVSSDIRPNDEVVMKKILLDESTGTQRIVIHYFGSPGATRALSTNTNHDNRKLFDDFFIKAKLASIRIGGP